MLTTFLDLNDDILYHISRYLARRPDYPMGIHWWNLPRRRIQSTCDIRALRAVCRHTRDAVPAPPLRLEFEDSPSELVRLKRWVNAPPEVLSRISFALLPSGRGDRFVSRETALARFASLLELLTRAPALSALELSHNLFCHHDTYGQGRDRDFMLAPFGDTPPKLEQLESLVVALKCRICALKFVELFSTWSPSLRALRYSLMATPPAFKVVPIVGPPWTRLRVLRLKISEEMNLPPLLERLAVCEELQELHISPYDVSRKIQVWDVIRDPEGRRRDGSELLRALQMLPHVHDLDLCLAPSVFGMVPECSEEADEAWRAGATAAASALSQVLPSLKRGWWWIQMVDLDYRQLRGYQRWSWTVENGEAVLSAEPQVLSPLVVRNLDGQGITYAIPSEEWN